MYLVFLGVTIIVVSHMCRTAGLKTLTNANGDLYTVYQVLKTTNRTNRRLCVTHWKLIYTTHQQVVMHLVLVVGHMMLCRVICV